MEHLQIDYVTVKKANKVKEECTGDPTIVNSEWIDEKLVFVEKMKLLVCPFYARFMP